MKKHQTQWSRHTFNTVICTVCGRTRLINSPYDPQYEEDLECDPQRTGAFYKPRKDHNESNSPLA